MALLLPLPPDKIPNSVQVYGDDGSTLHQMSVIWRNPVTDADKDRVIRANSDIQTAAAQAKAGQIQWEDADAAWAFVESLRQKACDTIRAFFDSVDDPAYEAGDLERMLPIPNYRKALLASLVDVANGEASRKNLPAPGTSTPPAGFPESPENQG